MLGGFPEWKTASLSGELPARECSCKKRGKGWSSIHKKQAGLHIRLCLFDKSSITLYLNVIKTIIAIHHRGHGSFSVFLQSQHHKYHLYVNKCINNSSNHPFTENLQKQQPQLPLYIGNGIYTHSGRREMQCILYWRWKPCIKYTLKGWL